jgi:hypothetical protein
MISARFRMVGCFPLRRVVSAGVLIGVLLYGRAGDSVSGPTIGLAVARADLADHHYKRALGYYESKDYARAIREFQAAYKVRQLPRILLNIGQVYRKLGMASTALKFYEHYLRVDLQPKPEIKAEVDRYIAQTRAMLDPPDIVPLMSKSAAAAAAEAVAGAPSDVTLVTVPEYYPEESDPPPKLGKDGRPIVLAVKAGTKAKAPPAGAASVAPPPTVFPPPKGWASPPVPPTSAGPAATNAALYAPPPARDERPIYKKGWFWGVVGGVAAGVVITGVAIGVSQKNAVPTTILYPTR